jgi:hypothetical protein
MISVRAWDLAEVVDTDGQVCQSVKKRSGLIVAATEVNL